MPKRKAGFDVDRLGSWYVPSKSQKRNAVDQVTKIMAPRSGVTGSEARDQIMAKVLGKGAPIGNRLFTTKKPYKPRMKRKRGGFVIQNKSGARSNISAQERDEINADTINKAMNADAERERAVAAANAYHKPRQEAQWLEDPYFAENSKRDENGDLVWDEDKLYPKTSFLDDFLGGFKKGFDGVIGIGKALHLPGSEYIPTLGDGITSKVHRLMPRESKISNMVGTGVHHSVRDIKLDPELRNAVAMVTGNTPLDKYAANSVNNLKAAHINHIKNLAHRRMVPGLRPRRKITKGGRTFTTLRNILVTPDAAP